MTVLFFAIYLTGLSIGSRFRLKLNSPATLILLLYFVLVEQLVALFLSVPFSNLLWKAIFFLSLIAIPTAIIAALTRISLYKILPGVCIGFVLILPISRPTIGLARAEAELKLRILPSRFTENISRLAPETKDIAALEEQCDSIPPREKTILIAYVRRLAATQSLTNTCTKAASHPRPAQVAVWSEHKPEEWVAEFQKAKPEARIAMLDELRKQKNPALLDRAIDTIEGDQEQLIIAAVRYLRTLSGKSIGNDKIRWQKWRANNLSVLNMAMLSAEPVTPVATKSFSAVQALDDLNASRETGEDFLQLYLKKHFPTSIDENDLQSLQNSIARLKGETVSLEYRRGVLFFFLALAETRRIAAGSLENPDQVSSHWDLSLQHFQRAGMVGEFMAGEVLKIITLADENRDHKLNSKELKHIIESRS